MFVSKTESLDRDKLEQYQLIKFRNMLGSILETNLFYRKKLNEVGLIHPDTGRLPANTFYYQRSIIR